MTLDRQYFIGSGRWKILYLLSYFWYFVFPGMLVSSTVFEMWAIARSGGTLNQGANALGMVMVFIFFPIVVTPPLFISASLYIAKHVLPLWKKSLFVTFLAVVTPLALGLLGTYMFNPVVFVLYFGGYIAGFLLHLWLLRQRLLRE